MEEGQPKADPSPLHEEETNGGSTGEEGKPARRFGKRKLTEEQQLDWRTKTKRKMKRSPRTTLRDELPEVLVSVLEEAHEGSCQHAKFLLEYAGNDSLPDAKEVKKNKSLVELLVERIGGQMPVKADG